MRVHFQSLFEISAATILCSAWPKKQKIKTPAKKPTKFQTEIGRLTLKMCKKIQNPTTISKRAEFWTQPACTHAKNRLQKFKRRAFADAGVTVPVHGLAVRVRYRAQSDQSFEYFWTQQLKPHSV